MALRALLLPIVLASCAAGVGVRVPGSLESPELPPAVAEAIEQARELYERGFPADALAAVEPLLAADPELVEGHRLRQDILRTRGRLALLRREAQERLAERPDDPLAHYLSGRVLPAGGAAQREAFARAIELRPDWLYPWLGYAFSLRASAPAESMRIYAQLFDACSGHRTVAVAYANTLRADGQLRDAVAVYDALAQQPETAGVGLLGRAQTLFAIGGRNDRREGFAALLAALRQRPFDPGAKGVIRELLRLGVADEQVEQIIDVLREDRDRMAEFARGGGAAVLVEMLRRTHQPHSALVVLREAAVSHRAPELRREQRRLLLTIGDVAGFLQLLAEDLPVAVLADETNQVRHLWRTLLDGPWTDGDPLANGARATLLVAALRDCGLLVEAEQVAGVARQRLTAPPPELDDLVAEVQRELAFENAVRRIIQQNYDPSTTRDLDQVLQAIEQSAEAILGHAVVEPDVRFSVPVVGEMLDPFASGLCRHLQRYNRHLVVGQRAGGATEGLSFTRLSVRDLPEIAELPVPGRCREVIGIDRDVRSLSGVLGGDLAGVALLNHYIVDYDAVSEWAQGLTDRRRIVAEDGGAAQRDGMLADGTGRFEPLDVGWRLAAMSPVQDSDLDAAVLEMIRLHERQHLVDSFHYLPIESNLWRGLGLLLSFGFSPPAIEGEMERRAELAALWLSAWPELVLAHIADFLDETDEASPHVRGFGQLGREITAALERQGVPANAAGAANWHLLDRETIRRAARSLYEELP